MSVSIHKVKKWLNMIRGNSVYHVNQNEGLIYSIDELKGYYNNLTEKITKFGNEYNGVPNTVMDNGKEVYFSISIFQYGLAAFDLYLIKHDEEFLKRAIECADWAINNQKESGQWDTFGYENPQYPYSSMAQGEAVSLLARVYQLTQNRIYYEAAQTGIDFLLKDVNDGGTALHKGQDLFLLEYVDHEPVLNGWIFSAWGVLDFYKISHNELYYSAYKTTLNTLKNCLSQYDSGYWSKYDLGNRIASPFYHSLHIAQLKVLYELTGEKVFMDYAEKWERYRDNFFKRKRAFIVKAWQKIRERDL